MIKKTEEGEHAANKVIPDTNYSMYFFCNSIFSSCKPRKTYKQRATRKNHPRDRLNLSEITI